MQSTGQSVTYHTAFVPRVDSESQASSLWYFPVLVTLALLLIRRPRRAVAIVYLGFGALITAGMLWFNTGWNRALTHGVARAAGLARAAQDSTTPVVVGRVENFTPAPAEGHQDETFTVAGVRFAYSDYVITGGFNQSQSHGGPMRDGLLVRIHYLPPSNMIVKLEIAN